jgi:SAM-dependent methyltransferase
MSTEFKWVSKDFDLMYQTCQSDDAVRLTIKYIPSKSAKVLEAGSGTGRVVKYLYDLGYKKTEGIELNRAAVKSFNKKFPNIKVIQGDILKMPYKPASIDLIASYGVVEHFVPGLEQPLEAFKKALKKGGILIASVPSMNIIRRIIYSIDRLMDKIRPSSRVTRNKGRYYIHPQFGQFFEYRLTPSEFITAAKKAGFNIVESVPIYHMDGLYHIFGEKFVKYINYNFYPTILGSLINSILTKIPFAHNHMHLLVLRKK